MARAATMPSSCRHVSIRVISQPYFLRINQKRFVSNFGASKRIYSLLFQCAKQVTGDSYVAHSIRFNTFSFAGFSNYFIRTRIVFSEFGATYFTHVMYTNCQISNFTLPFLSVSLLLPFSFHHSFTLSPNFHTVSVITRHSPFKV